MTAVELGRRGVMRLVPVPRPARTPVPATPVAGLAGVPADVREVLAGHLRDVDELAAMVEASIEEEDVDHALAVAGLRRGHQRRTLALVTLAGAIGQQRAELGELAHRLGINPDTPTSGGAR